MFFFFPERHSALVGGIALKFVKDRVEELGKGIPEAEELLKAGNKKAAYGKIDEMIAIAHEVLPIP